MERKQGKDRKSIIIICILLVATVTLSYFTFDCITKHKKYLSLNKELTSKVSALKNEHDDITKTKEEFQEEENSLNNLDEEIKKLKEEVFSLASKLEEKIINGETEYKIAYLTFDDGPYHSTDDVLDILDEYKIKATFFTIGLDKDICYDNKNYSCAETYKKEADRGHTMGNHTYSHAIWRGLYTSATSFMNEVKKQEALLEERTGVKTNIVRFPGGSATAGNLKNSIMNELRNNGYGWVDWTAGDGDGGYVANTTVAWSNLTSQINENIEVILFHDYSRVTISILPKAIEYLQEKNYILLPLFYESVKVNK